jgi:6-pyruvoyltetrahydropterin/6-carboxytetrahydropterin synthase
MITTITRQLEWDAAHRVLRHESKCGTLHGHRYRALVTVEADTLDGCDRVVDFSRVKELVGGFIDREWDHTTLVNAADGALRAFCELEAGTGKKPAFVFQGEPTAEVIARTLLSIASGLLADDRIRVVEVEVFETPNCSAKARRGDVR